MKKNRNVIIAGLLLIIAAAVFLNGCGNTYKITVVSEKETVEECPAKAKAGDTVIVKTMIVTDADLYCRVNGDPDFGKFTGDGVYEFVMPEEDVEIDVGAVANGLA